MNCFIDGKGNLNDKLIIKVLTRCVKDYEDGAIAEVRDVLQEIISAINEFEEYEEQAMNGGSYEK